MESDQKSKKLTKISEFQLFVTLKLLQAVRSCLLNAVSLIEDEQKIRLGGGAGRLTATDWLLLRNAVGSLRGVKRGKL